MKLYKTLLISLCSFACYISFSVHVSELHPRILNQNLTINLPDPDKKVESHWRQFITEGNNPVGWVSIDEDTINLENKNIAIIVPGIPYEILYDAFCHISFPRFFSKFLNLSLDDSKGLRETINIARYLSCNAKLQNDNDTNRFDLVLGIDYDSSFAHKTLGTHFANELNRFIKSGKNVVIITYGTGGLVARWALEQEGCGENFKDLITIGAPHKGILSPFKNLGNEMLPDSYISTIDVLVNTDEIKEDNFSPFLWELNKEQNPYFQTSNYYTIAGNDYSKIDNNIPYSGLKNTLKNAAAAGFVELTAKTMNNNNDAHQNITDGFIPIFSAQGEVLFNKSKSYAENNLQRIQVPLSYKTLAGVAPNPETNDENEMQNILTNALKQILDLIPIQE